MFISIWNYFRGYVMIKVSGFSVERFINLAANKGIYLWDLSYEGDAVRMKVSIKGFKMLKGCAKKTKCRIRILERYGLPFTMFRYRKRKLFVMGIFLFVLVVYALSSFIWVVEVEGNHRLSKEELLQFSYDNGVKPGSLKFGIDTKALTDGYILAFSDISWVAVEVTGTRAVIRLVETIGETPTLDRDVPCDVIASKDGLIESIVVQNGDAKVKAKDVVVKGQVLISGEIAIMEGEELKSTEFVHAQGEVYAKLWYDVSAQVPLVYQEKIYSGRSKTYYGINLLGQNLQIRLNPKYDDFDMLEDEKQVSLLGDYVLPVKLISTTYEEFVYETRTRTEEEAKEEGRKNIDAQIESAFDLDTELLEKQVYFETEGDIIVAKARIATLERIDEQAAITVEKGVEETTDGEINTDNHDTQ